MRKRIVIILVVLIVTGFLWAVWLLPVGAGEYRDSPDARWRAHASALSRGSFFGRRQQYVEVTVERLADGVVVWRRKLPRSSADTVPGYGDRDVQFIVWASNSMQFTVATTNGAITTVTEWPR